MASDGNDGWRRNGRMFSACNKSGLCARLPLCLHLFWMRAAAEAEIDSDQALADLQAYRASMHIPGNRRFSACPKIPDYVADFSDKILNLVLHPQHLAAEFAAALRLFPQTFVLSFTPVIAAQTG